MSKLPKEEDDEYDFVDIDELKAQEEEMKVEIEDGVYVVTGARVRKIVGSTILTIMNPCSISKERL